jgi:aspartyl protease family protein
MRSKSYSILPYGLNLFKVSAVVGGAKKGVFGKVFLLIDTGASFTLISNRVLQQLKYDVTKFEKTQQLITGKGATSPIAVININWFNCAGKVVNNYDILAYDIPKIKVILQL